MTPMRVVLAVLGLAALLASCADRAGDSGSPGTSPAGSELEPSGQPGGSIDPALDALVRPVVMDAASRLAVDPAVVALLSIDPVTWPDGSLGCPRPGELYTQALVDGHRIVVEAGGSRLDYRVTGPGAFRICENASTEP
jgi:hypothetical protein